MEAHIVPDDTDTTSGDASGDAASGDGTGDANEPSGSAPSAAERQRQANVERNNAELARLGLIDEARALAASVASNCVGVVAAPAQPMDTDAYEPGESSAESEGSSAEEEAIEADEATPSESDGSEDLAW
jgi:hypothetical protein